MSALEQRLCMRVETFEPGELVVELRAGLRIAVGKIQTADQNAVHGGFDITAVRVLFIAGQTATAHNRLRVLGEDRHAVPRCLSVPHGAIARASYRRNGELR